MGQIFALGELCCVYGDDSDQGSDHQEFKQTPQESKQNKQDEIKITEEKEESKNGIDNISEDLGSNLEELGEIDQDFERWLNKSLEEPFNDEDLGHIYGQDDEWISLTEEEMQKIYNIN